MLADAREGDGAGEELLEPARIEQPRLAGRRGGRGRGAEEIAAHGQDAAGVDAHQVVDPQLGPHLGEAGAPRARLIGEGGEGAGVERADRGAAEDVEGDLVAEVARHLVEHVLDDADLVGAARGPPGEDQGDASRASWAGRGGRSAHGCTPSVSRGGEAPARRPGEGARGSGAGRATPWSCG